MARHNVERATGKPSICSNPRRILSYDTPQIIFWNAAKASAWARNAPCPPRTPSKSAADAGHGHADHTPGMTHYELPGLGLDGRNVDLVQIDAPFRSYLTSARALLRARSLEGLVGNWVARTACRPYLDPGLRPGFGSRFGLSLEKGAAWRLPARHSSSTLSSNPGVPFLQLTLEIRVLHVQSTQLALKPFNPFAQFAKFLLFGRIGVIRGGGLRRGFVGRLLGLGRFQSRCRLRPPGSWRRGRRGD